jgi:hypothetical protein
MKPTTRKCKYCLERYTPKHSSLEPCPKYECRIKHLEANTAKINRANKAKAKDDIKSYAQRLGEAKKVFQKWIRIRDKDKQCISCGSVSSTVWDGGHYKKAEIYSGVIFHEHNVNIQCGKCNRYLGGNELNYRVGLIAKIGEQEVIELEQLAEATRTRKYTNEELEEIKLKYKA